MGLLMLDPNRFPKNTAITSVSRAHRKPKVEEIDSSPGS